MIGGGSPAVSLSGVCKSFGSNVVLQDVHLRVEIGSMVAVCGPSGCGKTTLLDIVGLLQRPDKGEILLLGEEAPRPRTRRATRFIREHINYLFQSFALVETEDVRKNLIIGLRYASGTATEKAAAVEEALTLVGLEGKADTPVYELSGGECQRVALARAMLKPGSILLADEPTGSLDSANRDGVVGLLRSMAQDGKAVLVVTHDKVVADACDTVMSLT